jgi:predicted ATPase
MSTSQGEVTQPARMIRTPDQRLRVFVSSTLQELAEERKAVKEAITNLKLAPVMFELGARPHPPRSLYRAYLEQSHVFIGIYWQRYGWIAPGMEISSLEDEYRLSGARPKLIYIKTPAPKREARLAALLDRIRNDDQASYRSFSTAGELKELVENDLAVLLTERFELGGISLEAKAPKSKLPVPPTPLIGRDEELRAVKALLLQDEVRLVTLSGPGGTGKTRLGLAVGVELEDAFADGVHLVSLVSTRDARLVASALAQALGIAESAQRPLVESLKEQLRDKEMLLLLDNFEQVVTASPLIAELLTSCPKLKMLITSRELLHLGGEHVFFVPPLAVPEGAPPLETLPRYAAVQLFIERAKAVKPNFALTQENAQAIAHICERLDGLPLAIELAAARIKLFSPQAMLARMGDRFLLASGARDLPPRQRTLHDTIGWSYELLSEEEKRLFGRLSVFIGGRTLEAVEAVCNQEGELDVVEGLTSLIDKNLLRQGEGRTEPRFVMLQTIHDYARERLEESDEAPAVRRAHGEYYLALAEEAEPQLTGAGQAAWLERLEEEHGNLRAALSWAQEAVQGEMALRLAGALWWFWYVRGYLSEARAWLAGALSQTETAERTAARAKVLEGAGVLAWAQGDNASARSLHEESLAINRGLGDKRGIALSLNNLGLVAHDQGDYASARSLLEESLALRQEIGERPGIAQSLHNLGLVAHDQGDYASARSLYEESLVLRQEIGERPGIAQSLNGLGMVVLDEGDEALARSLFEESLALFRELGDRRGLASSLEAFAALRAAAGMMTQAAHLWGAAEALREAIRLPRPPGDRSRYERYVTAARRKLGEAGFSAAWAEGRAMTLEEAVALADDSA